MAEALSPNPKQRLAVGNRPQSPTSPFFLGSNDDKLERAQARAARAAAIRRKAVAVQSQPPSHGESGQFLGKEQILELFQNCIKLASENKINQKNTWELNLIDHLYDIIKVEEEDDAETNFQKASCTLEAGVKIYSLRVDSVHSEAYKVLGGFNRVGQEAQDTMTEDASVDNGNDQVHYKKEIKISPLSTLESSFEALNVKKLDVAFAVDPLYHQTSAQFDEGGARGLLLNNLEIFGECSVLFDSMEVPGKCMQCIDQCSSPDTIDISFTKEYVEQMVLNVRKEDEISPTLKDIINQYDEDNKRPVDTFSSGLKSAEESDVTYVDEVDMNGPMTEDCGTWASVHDDQESVVEEDHGGTVPNFQSYAEEGEMYSLHGSDVDDGAEKIDEYLFLSLGLNSKQNAWAGPDHWKFRKLKGSEDVPASEKESLGTSKRSKAKKQAEPAIDFTKSLNEEMSDIFNPPKNPKSLLLPANKASCNVTLPEDCHYQPEDLVKLFLRPNVTCLGRRRKLFDATQQHEDDGQLPSWNGEDIFGGQFDDDNFHSDVEDSGSLVSQPRQVNKVEVQYDKTSKQVDVHALKETLWVHMQESPPISNQGQEATVSFRQILASFPSSCRAAASKDISPHLCFICLLHLANDHGLSIQGCADLDDLTIRLRSCATNTSEVV